MIADGKELIALISEIRSQYNCFDNADQKYYEALSLVLRILRHLPSEQPEKRTDKRTETHVCDYISRQAAIDAVEGWLFNTIDLRQPVEVLRWLPAAQPHITHCAECIHWKHSDVRKNYCEVFDWVNAAEDFCSFAERRTDE